MLLGWLFVQIALAEPDPVVAIGDGFVAPPAPAMGSATGAAKAAPAMGWVAVLADCLEERAAGRFAVVDRAITGETPTAAQARVSSVLELDPKLVLVGIASPTAEQAAAWRAEIQGLIGSLSPQVPGVLLVAVGRTDGDPAYAAILTDVTGSVPGVVHVELGDPATGEPTPLLSAGALTDQGHARVGAAVCDAVVGWKPPAPPE